MKGAQCELAAPILYVILPSVQGRFSLGVMLVSVHVCTPCVFVCIASCVVWGPWQGYARDLRLLLIVALGVSFCEGASGCPPSHGWKSRGGNVGVVHLFGITSRDG